MYINDLQKEKEKKVGSHTYFKKKEKSRVKFIVTGSLVGFNLTMYN